MQSLLRIIPILLLTLSQAFAGSPGEAAQIRKELTLATEAWQLKLKVAASPESQRELWKLRPNLTDYARRMWGCLRPSLAEDWTLEPAAWLLRISPGVVETRPDGTTVPAPVMAEAVKSIRQAVEKQHLLSPKLNPICLALISSQDPESIALLEKIQTQNPDPKVQGVAALAQAMLLKGFGDEVDVMRKRLTLIRKAIINSATEEVDGIPISRLAEDELYIISNLSKGRVAPEIEGVDSGARPMKLSDFKGKVVVLLFWGSDMPEAERTLEYCATLHQKFTGKPFALVGVNNDPVATLRMMQVSEKNPITWPNFSDPENKAAKQFRVAARPVVYVLDGDRKIRFWGAPGSFVELTVDAVLSEKKAPAAPAPDRSPPPR
jgi:peroxiredoxin